MDTFVSPHWPTPPSLVVNNVSPQMVPVMMTEQQAIDIGLSPADVELARGGEVVLPPATAPRSKEDGNATFYTFRPSGQWYESGRGFCPEIVFTGSLTHSDKRDPILAANGGKMPGLRYDGEGFIVFVILDPDVDYGWPLMLPIRETL